MIDVILPCWITSPDTINLTEEAITSIRNTCPEAHLIIIDNGSTQGEALLRSWADTYIRNKTNLGYAKAVNQGLKLAGSVVAVANNDIRVSSNWWNVAQDLLTNEDVGSVHFRMIPYDQPFSPGDRFWLKGKEKWCSSSFFVMRNGQLYDESFLNSYDDWDYWRRMRELGYFTAYTNAAEYQHLDSHTQMKRPDRSENDFKNRAYYKEKWNEAPEDWFARVYPEQVNQIWRPFP